MVVIVSCHTYCIIRMTEHLVMRISGGCEEAAQVRDGPRSGGQSRWTLHG